MPIGFSHYARRYLSEGEAFRPSLGNPFLFWQQPGLAALEEPWLGTVSGPYLKTPRAGEPAVFELKKLPGKPNAFAMGVTLGRIDTNDVCIEDASISRFHAWFQHDPRANEWVVVDAESKNGTWVGPLKLVANARAKLVNQTRLRFGDIEMQFLTADALLQKIREGLA